MSPITTRSRSVVAGEARTTSLGRLLDKVTPPGLTTFQIRPCSCSCAFCPDCARKAARTLRNKLKPFLEDYTNILMLTLTVDAELFRSPREAFDYIHDKKCISRLIRALRRYTHSGRYFCIMEWHDSGWTHHHVLLDATYIPHARLVEVWSRYRPRAAGPVVDGRPAFGDVHVSVKHYPGGVEEAASRASMYLSKVPDEGFPDWVMAMGADRRVRRYSFSQAPRKAAVGAKAKGQPTKDRRTNRTRSAPTRRTYSEKAADCGSTANVFTEFNWIDRDTGEEIPIKRWRGEIELEGAPKGQFRGVSEEIQARSVEGVADHIASTTGRPTRITRIRRAKPRGEPSPEAPAAGDSPTGPRTRARE